MEYEAKLQKLREAEGTIAGLRNKQSHLEKDLETAQGAILEKNAELEKHRQHLEEHSSALMGLHQKVWSAWQSQGFMCFLCATGPGTWAACVLQIHKCDMSEDTYLPTSPWVTSFTPTYPRTYVHVCVCMCVCVCVSVSRRLRLSPRSGSNM